MLCYGPGVGQELLGLLQSPGHTEVGGDYFKPLEDDN